MICELFKCFELLRLPLAPLTLLSGPNSSGKSSVLQVLVLLHQTMREHEWSTRLSLNGSGVHLGTVVDVVDEVHGRNGFEIGITAEDSSCRWTFDGDRREMSMRVRRVSVDGRASEDAGDVCGTCCRRMPMVAVAPLAARLRGLTYITAERVGPQEAYPLEDPYDLVVGAKGEHAVSVLHWSRDEPVLARARTSGSTRERCCGRCRARMRHAVSGMRRGPAAGAADERRHPRVADLRRDGIPPPDTHRIRPDADSADRRGRICRRMPGDLMLIENPEVHLHPAGQASMGEFLADVARAGVQVIVETHSDHVLNGIRRAVKSGTCHARSRFSFIFSDHAPTTARRCTVLTLDAAGNIDVWPEGFFDQFDKDMNYFAGWGD